MKTQVISINGRKSKSVDLSENIFGVECRSDILNRVVRWQRARKQQGIHKAKTRSETSYSKRKIFRQKGTGNARHGDRNAPIFSKGGVYKGPTPRDHSHGLPKKVRQLGLKMALSSKLQNSELVILSNVRMKNPKTSELNEKIRKLGWKKTLVIDGSQVDENFARAARNIPDLDVLPQQGANVYDILKCSTLVITLDGLKALQERMS
ncbi:MAG: 50S ribosomal protein L4 [Rhodobacteraceae bacterium]|nr:50S ribosomal protein L4 [Paracoccaceae bacterium]